MRMRVAKRVDGDAGAKIEVAFAGLGDEPRAFAGRKGEVRARIGWKQRRSHERTPCPKAAPHAALRPLKRKRRPAGAAFAEWQF